MKKLLKGLLFAFVCVMLMGASKELAYADSVIVNHTNFPDSNMRRSIIKSLTDYRNEDAYSYNKKTREYTIYTNEMRYLYLENVKNYTGIAYFSKISELDILNSKASTVDLGFASNLFSFKSIGGPDNMCYKFKKGQEIYQIELYGSFKRLDLRNVTGTEILIVRSNKLQEILLPAKNTIIAFELYANNLSKLDFSKLYKVESFYVASSRLSISDELKYMPGLLELEYTGPDKKLDFSCNKSLIKLVYTNQLSDEIFTIFGPCTPLYHTKDVKYTTIPANIEEINVHACSILEQVEIYNASKLKKLSLPRKSIMDSFTLTGTKLKSINLNDCRKLNFLDLNGNKALERLDISKMSELAILNINNCKAIKSIDTTNSPNLFGLDISNTAISKINLCKNPKLQFLSIEGLNLKKLDLSSNKKIRGMAVNKATVSKVTYPDVMALNLVLHYNLMKDNKSISSSPFVGKGAKISNHYFDDNQDTETINMKYDDQDGSIKFIPQSTHSNFDYGRLYLKKGNINFTIRANTTLYDSFDYYDFTQGFEEQY